MKKIFIPALLFLFVSSVALAETKVTFGGSYEFWGRYVLNNSIGDDDAIKVENAAYNLQYLELNLSASVDKFALYVDANPFDRKIGQLDTVSAGTIESEYIKRAFATYAFLPNLIFVGGRVLAGGVLDTGYEYLGFGSGAYNTLFSERVNGDGLGLLFIANDNLNFTLVNERYVEASTGDVDAGNVTQPGNSTQDTDGYILKANFNSGDITVAPYVSWITVPSNSILGALDETAHAFAFYVGGGLNPKAGLSVNAAFGLNKLIDGKSGTTEFSDTPLAFGGYLNVAFAQDIFKVGLEAAYASYTLDDDSGLTGVYQFGGDFDRTYVVDGLLAGTGNGVPAMTTIQLYAAITPIEKLTFLPRVAYYFSNVSESGAVVNYGNTIGIGEDTTFLEVDLLAAYAWTESTTVIGGVAYVQADKVGAAGDYKPDPSFGVALGLVTAF